MVVEVGRALVVEVGILGIAEVGRVVDCKALVETVGDRVLVVGKVLEVDRVLVVRTLQGTAGTLVGLPGTLRHHNQVVPPLEVAVELLWFHHCCSYLYN